MAAKPIIMTITDSAKNAMLDIENTGITLRLERLAIGSGRYNPSGSETALKNEISRHVITVGDIEPATHTLRLFSVVKATTETEVWELGLYDTENRLFALASSTDKPLFKVYPDIDFVGNFAIKLDAFDASKVQVVTDPNGALSLVLMSQHLAHPNPHPQYLLRNEYTPEPIKVGGILITTNDYANSQEVHDGEGYGKWAKFSEGQLLLGIGSHTDKNGTTKNISMMQQLGEYEHQLTIDEMPSHNHAYGGEYGGTKNTGTAVQSYEPWEEPGNVSSGKTLEAGGNQPHNNIQPSIGVGMWLRLPNDYAATSFDIYFTSDALGQNRVGQINEDSAIYLWIDVANATVPIAVSGFNQQGAGEFISDGANLTYPPTINNGKNLMIGVLPENYHVDMQTIIDWGFTLFDAAIGKTQTIHAGLTINDTVSDAPPYNGMKFEIYIRNNNGNIKVEPKVLENNSPYIIRAGDPVTEGQQGLVMTNLPLNLQKPFSYFTVEQNPINAYSGCAMTRYSSSEGTAELTVLTQKAFDDFKNGLIPDGTLINTVKLTYQP
ncbi:hypothetical protein ENHY17A_50387 [Moraxellaceae bacterium 17A]|nr:hypothetical protein ENHY17A_50387 [Moraxellaceae bacterium 17A]